MDSSTNNKFGLVIAYFLPGFVVVWGVSFYSPTLSSWLSTGAVSGPTVGGFLYVAMSSLAAGLTVSAARWAVVDTIHHRTGIAAPLLDFSQLQERLSAFDLAVEHYYRYYQFYGNTFVALPFLYGCRLAVDGGSVFGWSTLGFLVLEVVLFAASRDSLRRYYSRASQLLGTVETSETVSFCDE